VQYDWYLAHYKNTEKKFKYVTIKIKHKKQLGANVLYNLTEMYTAGEKITEQVYDIQRSYEHI